MLNYQRVISKFEGWELETQRSGDGEKAWSNFGFPAICFYASDRFWTVNPPESGENHNSGWMTFTKKPEQGGDPQTLVGLSPMKGLFIYIYIYISIYIYIYI